VQNNTNIQIYTYGSGNYSKGDKIIFEVWCEDGVTNTTKENTTEITVQSLPSTMTLYLNGTEWITNHTFEYPHPTKVNATINVSSLQAEVNLSVNETPVSNPYEVSHSLGTYNYTGAFTGNENYSSSSTTSMLTIEDTTPPTILNATKIPSIAKPYSNVTVTANIEDNDGIDYAYTSLYNISWDKVYEENLTQSTNEWFLAFNLSNITEGIHYINITAVDNSGNNRTEWVKNITVNYSSGADLVLTNTSWSTTGNYTILNFSLLNLLLEVKTTQELINTTIGAASYPENPVGDFEMAHIGKYVEVVTSSYVTENLLWVIVKLFYTDENVSSAGINESTLRLYYYNETLGNWSSEPGDVNTSGNYVWGNTTHFSFYGMFGETTTTIEPPSSKKRSSGSVPDDTTTSTTSLTTTTTKKEAPISGHITEKPDTTTTVSEKPRPSKIETPILIPVILIISIVVIFVIFYKKIKIPTKPLITKPKRLPLPPSPLVKINEILTNSEKYVGKKVMIGCEIISSELLPEKNMTLYRIKDSTGEIKGLSKQPGQRGEGIVEGIVKKTEKEVFIEF
ncbi:MAG: hypothetical protein KAT37_01475, partial [Candidatus Aenigmarchaeota archaeon]|nr:hypothetical protein [Candidatus Aenigmarchaeota archaeon]